MCKVILAASGKLISTKKKVELGVSHSFQLRVDKLELWGGAETGKGWGRMLRNNMCYDGGTDKIY